MPKGALKVLQLAAAAINVFNILQFYANNQSAKLTVVKTFMKH